MNYTITLTEKQLDITRKALDLYSRVLCGQLEEVERAIRNGDFTRNIGTGMEEHLRLREAANTMKYILFPEIAPASYGICSEEPLPMKAAVAYDIFQAIDQVLVGKKPFIISKEPIPTIERNE